MDGCEFLRKMQGGDVTAWDDLMPMLRRIVHGACHTLGIYDEVREDILQDVAIKVFTHWKSFSGQSAFSSWLYSIARNRCLDELRKRAVRGEGCNPGFSNQGNDDPETLDLEYTYDPKLELMLCVQQVLEELEAQGPARKNSHRIMDILLYWVEHSPSTEELAAFLNTTVQAAKQRKYEIRKRLEELCRRFCGSDDCSLQLAGGEA